MRWSLCLVVAAAPAGASGLLGFTSYRGGTTTARHPYRRQQPDARPLEPAIIAATSRDVEAGISNSSSSYSSSVELPRSSLLVRDQATGCDIYLVGCLHGSPTSGRDVQHVMRSVRPGAVVLELCESRHRSLRRDLEEWARGGKPLQGEESWSAAFKSWWKGMRKTSKKSGLLQALLAGALSAPFLLQRLGNFDPGLEFKAAMAYVDGFPLIEEGDILAEGLRGSSPPISGRDDCVVVLGDRDVQETLRRLGGALTRLTKPPGQDDAKDGEAAKGGGEGGEAVSHSARSAAGAESIGNSKIGGSSFLDRFTIVSDARVLRMALYGPRDREWPDSLRVFDTVWRERQTLATLLLPLMGVLYVLIEMSSRSIESAASAAVALVGDGGAGGFNAALLRSSELGEFLEAASDVGDTAFVLGAAWYMLRFFRLVIKERDDVLADSILKTCRERPGRPVVAVLGLLHCNGVAHAIRNSAPAQEAWTRSQEARTLLSGSGDHAP